MPFDGWRVVVAEAMLPPLDILLERRQMSETLVECTEETAQRKTKAMVGVKVARTIEQEIAGSCCSILDDGGWWWTVMTPLLETACEEVVTMKLMASLFLSFSTASASALHDDEDFLRFLRRHCHPQRHPQRPLYAHSLV